MGLHIEREPRRMRMNIKDAKDRFPFHCSEIVAHHHDELLWRQALAKAVPLFKTAEDDPLIAIFDNKGFYFSSDAERTYKKIRSEPHIYAARAEPCNHLYFGISNQAGGRWKRAHAYHLGTLAYEILGTKRYDDQNHKHWLESWFDVESFKQHSKGPIYQIRMKKLVVISFFVPEFRPSKIDLIKMESRLIALAKRKGFNVLNLK